MPRARMLCAVFFVGWVLVFCLHPPVRGQANKHPGQKSAAPDETKGQDPPSQEKAENSAKEKAAASGENTAGGDEEVPPALVYYKGRKIAEAMSFHGSDWLIRATREQEENTTLLFKTLNFQPGQVVCDMGCGNGYYTVPIAEAVGETGRVLAVDIQPEMLTLLDARSKDKNLPQIEPILGTLIDPHLPEGAVDMILCVDVYHEFSHPEHMLSAMRKALKPDGRLILVEFREEDVNVPIKPEHKMSKKQILKELRPNGFKLVEEFDGLPWQHVMYFQKTPDKPAKGAKKPAKGKPSSAKSKGSKAKPISK